MASTCCDTAGCSMLCPNGELLPEVCFANDVSFYNLPDQQDSFSAGGTRELVTGEVTRKFVTFADVYGVGRTAEHCNGKQSQHLGYASDSHDVCART